MVEPRHVHWIEEKNMLRYLHGMIGYGLRYVSDSAVKLQGYTNSDWAGSAVDREKAHQDVASFWDQVSSHG
jgi:hypothetical protein